MRKAFAVLLACLFPLVSVPAFASAPAIDQAQGAVLRGETVAQDGGTRLPGIVVTVTPADSTTAIAETVSDAVGSFEFNPLPPGAYDVRASADGFREVVSRVEIAPGEDVSLLFTLSISASDRIEVSAETVIRADAKPAELEVNAVRDLPVIGSAIDAARALMAGIVLGPDGRASIRGAGPMQSGIQINSIDATDPSVLGRGVDLPDGAIASVRVLPNPYAVEFGRFSSGLTVLQTQTGSNTWRLSTGDLLPSFQTSRGYFRGLRWFSPEGIISGPIVPDKLFVSHSTHYFYNNREIYSRPDDESVEQRNLRTFGRVDAVLAPGQRLAISGTGSTARMSFATLDTFHSPDATANSKSSGGTVTISSTNVISPVSLLETTMNAGTQNISVRSRGDGPMVIFPDITEGSYFNDQQRQVRTLQVVQSLARAWTRPGVGEHNFKIGYDLLVSRFRGASISRPVEIRRADGTLAELMTFDGFSMPNARAADVAIFAQDGWHPHSRLSIDGGVRMDRDGVLRRTNLTARTGGALALNDESSAVIRGGFGTFFERVPLTVAAFSRFEAPTITRFMDDGITPVAPPQRYPYRKARGLETPRSTIWNIGFEQIPATGVRWRVGYLDRRDSHRLIVEPITTPSPAILLSSEGQGHYRDVEVGFTHKTGRIETDVAYVRAWSETDLNAYELYFRNFRNPVVRENGSGPSDAHVPNRLQVRNRLLMSKWVFGSVLETRTGFPYSAVDENQDFVGARNRAGRLPTGLLLDLSIQREVPVLKWRPWVGVTIRNVFDSFVPAEVQRNIDSPRFGTFFNSRPREINVTVRIR